MTELTPAAPAFVETQEYRRFAEFCDACRQYRYIGLCHGAPGVGKTLSARHYAGWEVVGPVIEEVPTGPVPDAITVCHTLFYTPTVGNTPHSIERGITDLRAGLEYAAQTVQNPAVAWSFRVHTSTRTTLLIVDEADRLRYLSLEQLRDLYDRGQFGLVLIGMPGLERRLARYAQFYSRIGFVHQFRPLSGDELRFLLAQRWQDLGLSLDLSTFDDVEALSAIVRITGGNLRLVHRLFAQIARILAINQRDRITKEVVEAARASLVIGAT
jgi:DNA transposition AAA+ family ATPase